jgi:hypothetical protein
MIHKRMDVEKNKFIVFHHGGSRGDFLCSAVNYLNDKTNHKLKIFESGQFNAPDENYRSSKQFCYKLTVEQSPTFSMPIFYCMSAHHYSPMLNKIFPKSKFYYIDHENYEENLLKRLFKIHEQLEDSDVEIIKNNKIVKFKTKDSKKIRIAATKSWKKIFEFYEIESIKFQDLFTYDNFKNMLETKFSLSSDEDLEKFYNIWLEKNKNFLKIK